MPTSTMLGNLKLSEHLQLRGTLDWARVQIGTKRTIDGLLLVDPSPPMQGGRPLTLDGSEGHFTVGQLKAALELQAAGQPVSLRHHQGQFDVMITGVTGPELWFMDAADYDDNDEIAAQINLIEVSP